MVEGVNKRFFNKVGWEDEGIEELSGSLGRQMVKRVN